MCGTPNYIAPEVLEREGHSVASEMWAVGCTLYAMLVGRPPFETCSLEATYERIRTGRYQMPAQLSWAARDLLHRLLSGEPSARPKPSEALAHPFFDEPTPGTLPNEFCVRTPTIGELMAIEDCCRR